MTGQQAIETFGINPTSTLYRPGANNQTLSEIPLPTAWRPGIKPGSAQALKIETDDAGNLVSAKLIPDRSKLYAGIVLGILALILLFLIIRKIKKK